MTYASLQIKSFSTLTSNYLQASKVISTAAAAAAAVAKVVQLYMYMRLLHSPAAAWLVGGRNTYEASTASPRHNNHLTLINFTCIANCHTMYVSKYVRKGHTKKLI